MLDLITLNFRGSGYKLPIYISISFKLIILLLPSIFNESRRHIDLNGQQIFMKKFLMILFINKLTYYSFIWLIKYNKYIWI